MAKPTNTIGDRDYGRRTYASKKKYEDQRKLASDANIDRAIGKQKHSEYKKPYIPDQSYPEMEMYNIPWTPPVWPKPPPENPVVVIPGEPGGPIPPVRPTPPRELPPFLGCMFFSRRIRPTSLKPGQMAYGGIDFGNEDYISSIKIFGPGDLLSTFAACNQKETYQISGYKPQKSGTGFCTIIVKARTNPRDFDHVTEYFTIGKDAPGPYPIIVEVKMQSGAVCTEMIEVETCPADPPLAWDDLISATTISRWGSVLVAVKGGLPPYNWSVSGATGVTLRISGLTGATNYLDADATACGAAQIVVIDGCGSKAYGDVLVLDASSWKPAGGCGCLMMGPFTSYEDWGHGSWVFYIRQVGRFKCGEAFGSTYGGAPDCATCEPLCLNTGAYCSATCGCSAGCITNAAQDQVVRAYGSPYYVESKLCWGYPPNPAWKICVCRATKFYAPDTFCAEWKCT